MSKEFDLIYQQALEANKSFPEYQFKTVSALLIIIGWLLSSTTAQTFIKQNCEITLLGSILAFALLIVFKIIWVSRHYNITKNTHKKLLGYAKRDNLDIEAIEIFKVGPVLPITYTVVNIILSSIAITIVWIICK